MTTEPASSTSVADRLAAAEAALDTRYRELAQITAALVNKEAEVADLEERLAARERALAEASAALVRAQRDIDAGAAQLSSIQTSTSWRLTAPLRALGRRLGR